MGIGEREKTWRSKEVIVEGGRLDGRFGRKGGGAEPDLGGLR